MSFCRIYSWTNTLDHKRLIGQSWNIKRRKAHHLCEVRKNRHVNPHFQSAWNKYGESIFEFEIIESIDNPTQDVLDAREQYWILYYNSLTEGYNLKMGGSNGKQSEITKKRNSKSKMGSKNPMYGKVISKEERQRKSKINKKIWKSWPKSKQQKIINNLVLNEPVRYPSLINVNTGEIIPSGENISELSNRLNVHNSNLYKVITGERKTTGGWALLKSKNRAMNRK